MKGAVNPDALSVFGIKLRASLCFYITLLLWPLYLVCGLFGFLYKKEIESYNNSVYWSRHDPHTTETTQKKSFGSEITTQGISKYERAFMVLLTSNQPVNSVKPIDLTALANHKGRPWARTGTWNLSENSADRPECTTFTPKSPSIHGHSPTWWVFRTNTPWKHNCGEPLCFHF